MTKVGQNDKLIFYKLTKAHWKQLEKKGLVDNSKGYGNGFSNTTKYMDNEIGVSASYYKLLTISNNTFAVKYESGCFYPCWYQVLFKGGEIPKGIISIK
jgi:predicted nucleic-acid-binding Zn-ribbon protein